jgi:hypothetical protein
MAWTLVDVLTVTHNFIFIGLLFVGWLYIYMKSHQLACVSKLRSSAIFLYILMFIFVLAELAFCITLIIEYNKVSNPTETVKNAKTGLYIEIGLLSVFILIGLVNLIKLFKNTYC